MYDDESARARKNTCECACQCGIPLEKIERDSSEKSVKKACAEPDGRMATVRIRQHLEKTSQCQVCESWQQCDATAVEKIRYCNPGIFRKRLIFVLFVNSWNS